MESDKLTSDADMPKNPETPAKHEFETSGDWIKYLEMLQAIITRMAANSFLLKGWGVTLVAGLFAIGAKDAYAPLIFFAIVPVLVFWGLDGYFLSQERSYRWLFNRAVAKYRNDKDASSDKIVIYDMNASGAGDAKTNCQWLPSMFSITLILFYGVLVISVWVAGRMISSRPVNPEAAVTPHVNTYQANQVSQVTPPNQETPPANQTPSPQNKKPPRRQIKSTHKDMSLEGS